ncbi:MAG: rhamnose/proton symporter RhaT, partial [Hyphomicrobiales bacterium]
APNCIPTLLGIALVARAGQAKDREGPARGGTNEGVQEFNLKKGIAIAAFSGVMSGCFAWGLAAGEPIRQLSLAAGTARIWQGLPVLCIVLTGGLMTNLLWCAYLIMRNGSAGELVGKSRSGVRGPAVALDAAASTQPLLLRNYLLAALGGTLWYFQFFFYTMGESQMGRFGFSSWTLHMASIILFSTLWGFALREWGAGLRRLRRSREA